jgi:hypothetical protein
MGPVSSGARQVSSVRQTIIVLGGAVFCVALIVIALMMSYGENGEQNRGQSSVSRQAVKKSLPVVNIALGNVVAVVAELGLTAKNTAGVKIETPLAVTRIESQLTPLREFYRAESEARPALMGGLLLELTVGSSGEVTHIREISTRIADKDFRKSVIAAAAKWEFNDILPDGGTIVCPLLFVREGMDMTTLVQWEKHLGLFQEKHVPDSAASTSPSALAPVGTPSNPSVEDKTSDTVREKTSGLVKAKSTQHATQRPSPPISYD